MSYDSAQQMSHENKEKYQLGDYYLIQYQSLQTHITVIVWQTLERIAKEILRMKGLENSLPS